MLIYQIYDIDYTPKYECLKLKISNIQGLSTGGARQEDICWYWLGRDFETQLQIQVKELLLNDAYFSKVMNNKKSWFTPMQVLDLINHQFLFTTNSLGCQPMTSQYFKPLVPHTLALAAAANHCALSEYASGKTTAVLFSQDEYQGTFCPFPVINITTEAAAVTNQHSWATWYPPFGATPLQLALPNLRQCSSASIDDLQFDSTFNSSSFSTPRLG